MPKKRQHLGRVMAVLLVAVLALASCVPESLDQSAGAAAAIPEVTTDDQAVNPQAQITAEPSSPQVDLSGGAIAAFEGALQRIYEQVNASVVHIQVRMNAPDAAMPGLPGVPGLPQPGGEGSGFVWDRNGHIVTNNHVVAGASEINVAFADDTIVPATVVGTDPDSDLAVLKVDIPAEALQPVQVADSTEVKVGDLVIAIGNPFGQEGTMTVGFVSALGRLLPASSDDPLAPQYSIPDIIQTDAAINPGNSGGVLLNDQGEVVGVTTAIISPARVSSGIGFAVPSVIVDKVVPALIADGEYQHPFLGITGTTLTPDLAQAMDLPADQRGALLLNVSPDSPAAEAGLQPSERQVEIDGTALSVGGDVITAIEGTEVRSTDDLITYLARHGEVGEQVTLEVLRAGEEVAVTATLAARPRSATSSSADAQAPSGAGAWLGILGADMTAEAAAQLGLDPDQDGVYVAEVVPEGPAAQAGLAAEDVIIALNEIDVSGMNELISLLTGYEPGDEVSVTVIRGDETMTFSVTLGEQAR